MILISPPGGQLAAGAGFAPTLPPSKGGVLLIRRPATKWWAREDLHLQGSQILDLWGLLFPLNHSPENGVQAGLAGFSPATTAFGGLRSDN